MSGMLGPINYHLLPFSFHRQFLFSDIMSFPNRSAWLSIFLSVAVLSIPITDKISPAAGFTVHQVSNPRFVANETQHLRASYAKYQSYSNQSTNASNAASGASDEVVATPVAADSEYLVPVTVQGQELIMNIDTGSADLYVHSSPTTELPLNNNPKVGSSPPIYPHHSKSATHASTQPKTPPSTH